MVADAHLAGAGLADLQLDELHRFRAAELADPGSRGLRTFVSPVTRRQLTRSRSILPEAAAPAADSRRPAARRRRAGARSGPAPASARSDAADWPAQAAQHVAILDRRHFSLQARCICEDPGSASVQSSPRPSVPPAAPKAAQIDPQTRTALADSTNQQRHLDGGERTASSSQSAVRQRCRTIDQSHLLRIDPAQRRHQPARLQRRTAAPVRPARHGRISSAVVSPVMTTRGHRQRTALAHAVDRSGRPRCRPDAGPTGSGSIAPPASPARASASPMPAAVITS